MNSPSHARTAPSTPDELFAARWEHARRHPEDSAAWRSFAYLLARTEFAPGSDVDRLLGVLLACLARDDLDPQPLAGAAMQLLRRDPRLAPALEAAAVAPDSGRPDALEAARRRLDVAVGNLTPDAFDRSAVLMILTRMVLPSMAFERMLCALRRHLLSRIADSAGCDRDGTAASSAGRVMCALAHHCFLNGYVWAFTDEEGRAVERLARTMWEGPLTERHIASVSTLAAYVPLWTWDRAEDLVDLAESAGDAWFTSLVRQQVAEPLEEMLLSSQIPTLGLSGNPVSELVRAQYEEHPYPRWTAVEAHPYESVAEALRDAVGPQAARAVSIKYPPSVLVAGCGTGRQVAQVAQRFPGARVVGLDLSLTSLAYARRLCDACGLADVTLLQADILALEAWHETFDIVECGGVLHHLEDPAEGWRILRSLVRPGGLMRIALYSETARRDVTSARAFIAGQGFEASESGIRAARPVLAAREAAGGGSLLRLQDFYTLPECRDLLFHVQEHLFTLPRIAEILDSLDLDFLGFEIADASVLPDFRDRFPAEGAERSLEAWHAYEQRHPGTFRSMYQFWVGDGRGAGTRAPVEA